MANSKKEKQLEDSWGFLDDYDRGTVATLAMALLEDRIDQDKRFFLDSLDGRLSPLDQFQSDRRFSLACIEEASELNMENEFKESVILSAYSSIFNHSGDIEWIWDIKPLSCSKQYNLNIETMQDALMAKCAKVQYG